MHTTHNNTDPRVPPAACPPVPSRPLISVLARPKPRGGFTLVEMLVSTALIVLMMAMFATIFQLAAGAIGTQRGIANNDQRARTMTTIIRTDLDNRTFRNLIPFEPGETDHPLYVGTPLAFLDQREGYFYISENDIYNDADDVLQFTAEVDVAAGDPLYVGSAVGLGAVATAQNQPLWDDGQVDNNASQSQYAEISYFLRNGNLYRRVLLIRSPLDTGPAGVVQPSDNLIGAAGPGAPLIVGVPMDYDAEDPSPRYTVGPDGEPGVAGIDDDMINGVDDDGELGVAGDDVLVGSDFLTDFDFSAYYDYRVTLGAIPGVVFHGQDGADGVSLDNSIIDVPATLGTPVLGKPRYRYGHDQQFGSSLPREFVGVTYIGRFTHEETSHHDFQYPGTIAGPYVNPMDPLSVPALTGVTNGTVNEFSTTPPDVPPPRRAEDVLLANVHSFDIKIWDDELSDFVDVGNPGNFGDWNADSNQHPSYGPRGAIYGADGLPGAAGVDDDGDTFIDSLPGPDGQPGHAGIDDDGVNGVDDPGELGFIGTDDRFDSGEVGFGDDGVLFADHNRVFDTWHPFFDLDGVDEDDTTGADRAPYRPGDGIIKFNVGEDGQPGVAIFDDDGDTIVDNAIEIGFLASDDQPDITHLLGPDGRPGESLGPGPDGLPGFATVDDDADTIVDNQSELGFAGTDDTGNEDQDTDPDFVNFGFDQRPGVAGVDDDGDTIIDASGVGPDGAWGVAGVNDDGIGIADDILERGWFGSDDIYDTNEVLFPGSDDVPDLGEFAWPLTDDFIGVRAIRITIRYLDPASDQLRQLTMEHSLID